MQKMQYEYFSANRIAGYSGFIIYSWCGDRFISPSASYWMIQGTWDFDWDNR